MRNRKKKHGTERLAACSELFISSPEQFTAYAGNSAGVEVEIGCGKGRFITQLCRINPQTRYLAVERVADIILAAAEKVMSTRRAPVTADAQGISAEPEDPIENVRFIVGSADGLPRILPPHSVRRIYLNFPDPWGKTGYAKRRLTSPGYLALYRNLLAENGEIVFKTDNAALFEYSLRQFSACGYLLREVTRDLHAELALFPDPSAGIRTEYETNFSEKGFKIQRAVAVCVPLSSENVRQSGSALPQQPPHSADGGVSGN